MGLNFFVNGYTFFLMVNIILFVSNLIIFIIGKAKGASANPFSILWTGVVSIFVFAFSKMMGHSESNITTKNALSPEIILFIFLYLFTLTSYAVSLINIDILVSVAKGSDDDQASKIRNIVNAAIGLINIITGVYVLSLGGKYRDRNGRINHSHKSEMTFLAVLFIFIGIMILITSAKRLFFRLSFDLAERNSAKDWFSQNHEWQPGEALPVYEKIVRYVNGKLIMNSFILISVFTIIMYFIGMCVDQIFFKFMFGSVLFLILGFSFYMSYSENTYIKNYQFRWKYGMITDKQIITNKSVEKYSGGSHTTITNDYYVAFDFGETYKVNAESYNSYHIGSEVFVFETVKNTASVAFEELSEQNTSDNSKNYFLYG